MNVVMINDGPYIIPREKEDGKNALLFGIAQKHQGRQTYGAPKWYIQLFSKHTNRHSQN